MKTKVMSLFVGLSLMGVTSVFAQTTQTEEFKVYGNCGMCKTRIENAVKTLDGISKADWNIETKMIVVTFNPEKVNLNEIHKSIVHMGHDTDKMKADDEVYNKLPGCCKYERSVEKNHDGHTDHTQ